VCSSDLPFFCVYSVYIYMSSNTYVWSYIYIYMSSNTYVWSYIYIYMSSNTYVCGHIYRLYTKEWCGFNSFHYLNRTILLCIPCITGMIKLRYCAWLHSLSFINTNDQNMYYCNPLHHPT
jgi:hypothetical protein